MIQVRGSIGRRGRLVAIALIAAVIAALGLGAPASGAAAAQGNVLYAGGQFTSVGGVQASRIAVWNGVDWNALRGPAGEGADEMVDAMTFFRGKLIVAGSFIEAGGVTVSGIASWDGTRWAPLTGASGIPGVTVRPLGFVSDLEVYNGDLYVAGAFPRAGATTTVNSIARWDGTEWHALNGPGGPGVLLQNRPTVVWDLTVHNGRLIAAGEFDSAGGVTSYNTAAWNGTTWSSLGMPAQQSGGVMSMAVYNGALVASRSWVEDNVGFAHVLRYDGTTWTPMSGPGGAGFDQQPRVLTVYRGQLIAGGDFNSAGGVAARAVARWNGNAWSALPGAGVEGPVYAMTVHNDTLVAGGWFFQAGGVTVNHIARWNGSAWSALPGRAGVGANDAVFALLSGPAL